MYTIKASGEIELEVRRSRFICALARAGDEAQAQAFIAERRRAHRAATHHCTAYVLGERGEITRGNDDGEPAGTAGTPMLEVLTRRRLTGVVAVVTRYFGGIKLGAAGLVRAYGQAVGAAVDEVGLVVRRPAVTVTVTVDHARAGRLQGDLRTCPYRLTATRYGTRVELDLLVPTERLEDFDAWLAALTAGNAETRHGTAGYVETEP